MTTIPTTAVDWASALDDLTADHAVSDVIGGGYADGSVAGVGLSTTDERIDDERSQIVSSDGLMVVRYDPASAEWLPVSG